MKSSHYKCNKYLNKIKNTSPNSSNFKIYLDKLNFYYSQIGGICPPVMPALQEILKLNKWGEGSFGTVYGDEECVYKHLKNPINYTKEFINNDTNEKLKKCNILYQVQSDEANSIFSYNNQGSELYKYYVNIYSPLQTQLHKITNVLDHINFPIQIAKDLQCAYSNGLAYYDLKLENILCKFYKNNKTDDAKLLADHGTYPTKTIFKYKDGTNLCHASITIIDIAGFDNIVNDKISAKKFTHSEDYNTPIEIYTSKMYNYQKDGFTAPLLTGFLNIIFFFIDPNFTIQYFLDDYKVINIINMFEINGFPYRDHLQKIIQTCTNIPTSTSFNTLIFHLEAIREKYDNRLSTNYTKPVFIPSATAPVFIPSATAPVTILRL